MSEQPRRRRRQAIYSEIEPIDVLPQEDKSMSSGNEEKNTTEVHVNVEEQIIEPSNPPTKKSATIPTDNKKQVIDRNYSNMKAHGKHANNTLPPKHSKRKKNLWLPIMLALFVTLILISIAGLAYWSYFMPIESAQRMLIAGKYTEAFSIVSQLPQTDKVHSLETEIREAENDSILNQAESLINRGKHSEADVVLAGLPESERKSKLVTQIVLYEAQEALDAGNYVLAEKKIAMLPPEEVDADMLYEINTQQATALLGQGRYAEADALYAEQNQTDEIKSLREQLFYESRILVCAAEIQDTLIFPESLVLEEVLLKNTSDLNKSISTDTQNVYEYGEPNILFHYRAKSRGGSMVDGFVRFIWADFYYEMQMSVDTLETDDEKPWNYEDMDSEEQREYLKKQVEIFRINVDLLSGGWFETYDMKRMNDVIAGGYADSVKMLEYNDIVPKPTPRIQMITPKPTASTL